MESQNIIGTKQPQIAPAVKYPKIKKDESKKLINLSKYPRFHNDNLRCIIEDLKDEIINLRKKCETYESMYRKLEREFNDYKSGIITVREMDILGDDFYQNPRSEVEIEPETN